VSDLGRDAVTSATTSVSPKSAQLACPDQKKLLGGGARLTGGGQQVALQASFPDADNIYRATAREVVATPATWSLTVYAVCANAD
jgi:hypothetical protein